MKAVFFDKDGTLIEDIPYNIVPDLIKMKDHAIECLSKIKALDYLIILVTNQSGVARGLFTEEQLTQVEGRIRNILSNFKIPLDGFYYCPHYPEGSVKRYSIDCSCRKPLPGMMVKAAKDFGIGLSESWMVGDKLDDIEAGNRAGCKTILIDGKQNRDSNIPPIRVPAFTVTSLDEVSAIIEQNSQRIF